MSKKIYICKEILASSVSCSGKGLSSKGFGNTAANDVGLTIQYDPFQVPLYRQNSTTLSGATINAVADQSARLTNFCLTIFNSNKDITYKESDYYLLYANKVTLSFTIYVNFKCNGRTFVDTITASIQGSAITSGMSSYNINIYETFNNIKSNSYPLTSLSIDTTSSAVVSFNDGSADTSKLIVCMQMTNKIKPASLNGILKTASSNSALFSATIPDASRAGRVFVTYFEIGEQAFSHCLYSYRGYTESAFEITHYPEPCATSFYRSSGTWYDAFEFDDGEYNSNGTPTYRNPRKDYISLEGIQSDTVASTFDSVTIYKPDYYDQDNVATFTSWSTGLSWDNLERIAWLDGVKIRLVERGGIGVAYSAWTPLIDAIINGIDIPSNVHTIEVEMIVPDLCTLTSNNFTNNPQGVYPYDYLNGFYPYNNLKLHLRLGYQTASLGTAGATYAQKEQGLYCGTHKVKRMIVNSTNEIQYFVVDAEE